MKIFFDTEFIENGKTIDLISIGLVKESGESLYLQSNEYNLSKASKWVKDNVIPNLLSDCNHTRKVIAEKVKEFCGERPEFWAYYADYDWVVLCQLFGTMMDLPDGWPMYCRDLKQLMDDRNIESEQEESNHNALDDAFWVKATYENLPVARG